MLGIFSPSFFLILCVFFAAFLSFFFPSFLFKTKEIFDGGKHFLCFWLPAPNPFHAPGPQLSENFLRRIGEKLNYGGPLLDPQTELYIAYGM